MPRSLQEATQYHVSEVILYWTENTIERPKKLLVSVQQKQNAMETAHKLSRQSGREGTLRKGVKWNWLLNKYVDIKDWVKTCGQCEKRAPLWYNEPLESLIIIHQWR
jgi:hypothetical protein